MPDDVARQVLGWDAAAQRGSGARDAHGVLVSREDGLDALRKWELWTVCLLNRCPLQPALRASLSSATTSLPPSLFLPSCAPPRFLPSLFLPSCALTSHMWGLRILSLTSRSLGLPSLVLDVDATLAASGPAALAPPPPLPPTTPLILLFILPYAPAIFSFSPHLPGCPRPSPFPVPVSPLPPTEARIGSSNPLLTALLDPTCANGTATGSGAGMEWQWGQQSIAFRWEGKTTACVPS